ncbi:bifunctional POPLD domain/Pop1 [Babesia duncani]|uniref:Bifunctional POPLD domain/Pop1 n=1 Tax=Babesia duncani TaxID=323732 RepID=A0AAD9PJ71_9APIC|nr:bifunctional POPLD domain/Pop1 [Babesia duncani]
MGSNNPKFFDGQLPDDYNKIEIVNVMKLLESRGSDIKEMFEILKSRPKQDRAFQRLPFAMRRRSMSHNPFRVPKKIRIHIVKEMAKTAPKAAKRLRKDKRRKLNRLQDYQNRCMKNQWLETHIFHAKRFKMINIWGYRLADISTQKCKRKCIRFARRMCLLHDKSYTKIICVSGQLHLLKEAFQQLLSDSELLFHERYLSGNYQGGCTFAFSNGGKYAKLICGANFLWKPEQGLNRTIFFMVHPAACESFYNHLSMFKTTVNVSMHPNITYFELHGPMSHLLLRCALKVDADKTQGNKNWKNLCPKNSKLPPSFVLPLSLESFEIYSCQRPTYWISTLEKMKFKNEDMNYSDLDKERNEFFNYKHFHKPNFVSKVTVPRRRRKNYGKLISKLLDSLNTSTPNCNVDEIHQKTNFTTQKDQNLNVDSEHIPILLIPKKHPNLGFDLLIHSGTIGTKIWMLLCRCGALPIGLSELELLRNEFGHVSFPQDFPDTNAGIDLYSRIKTIEGMKYLLCPYAKRPNYTSMGIDGAFDIPRTEYSQLTYSLDYNATLKTKSKCNTDLIRNGYIYSRFIFIGLVTSGLIQMENEYRIPVLRLSTSPSNPANIYLLQLLKKIESQYAKGNPDLVGLNLDPHLYISVRIKLISRGRVNFFTRVYLPMVEDIQCNNGTMKQKWNCEGFSSQMIIPNIVEPVHEAYKVSNLKKLFYGDLKNKKLNETKARLQLDKLRQMDQNTIRTCIGFITTKGNGFVI